MTNDGNHQRNGTRRKCGWNKRKNEPKTATNEPSEKGDQPTMDTNEKFAGFAKPKQRQSGPNAGRRNHKYARDGSQNRNHATNRKPAPPSRNTHPEPPLTSPKKRRLQHSQESTASTSASNTTLVWQSIRPHVPVSAEEGMLDLLIVKGKKERSMLKNHSDERRKQISKRCKTLGLYFLQAASLRRHHVKHLNKTQTMTQLGLGARHLINQAAEVFEQCVATYLRQERIDFIDEAAQRKKFEQNASSGTRMPPTPDFMLTECVKLSLRRDGNTTEHGICWIEAKMFYGASTIPEDGKSAVGSVLRTARKYVKAYGPGAMVFSYGCGDQLARELFRVGVVALDSHPIDLRPVERHQRTWCANRNGLILP